MSAAANAAGYLYRQGVIGPNYRKVDPGAGRVVEPVSLTTAPAARIVPVTYRRAP